MKVFKYLVDPNGNVSYIKVETDYIQPEDWILTDTKPIVKLTTTKVNEARDLKIAASPLITPFGAIDYDNLSREKLSVAEKAITALDALYPESAPHKRDWTMHDNSLYPIGVHEFQLINITSAIRGFAIHTAAIRIKIAINNNQPPNNDDLVLLGLT